VTDTFRVRRPLQHWTYYRPVSAANLPAGTASTNLADFNLYNSGECRVITMNPGAQNDVAEISVFIVAPDSVTLRSSVEDKLGGGLFEGDLVRTYVEAPEDAAYAVGTPQCECLFEGVVIRRAFAVGSREGQDTERVTAVATWSPGLDNQHPDHLVPGRWFFDLDSEADPAPSVLVEDPDLPACFNFRGRPNRDAIAAHAITAAGYSGDGGGGGGFTASPFTGDHDPAGAHWTVREALASLVVRWLYGDDDAAGGLDRHVALEPATAAALLNTGEPTDLRFTGINARLPETDVTGLGVYDAIQRVCEAGGFGLSITPAAFTDEWSAGSGGGGGGGQSGDGGQRPDRVYILSVYRLGVGRAAVFFKLPKRGQFPGKVEGDFDVADVGIFQGTEDAAAIVNVAHAAAPARIEARFDLRPLWSPDDVDATAVDASLQGPGATTYHAKHVRGGADFADYGHVGRAWGLDCQGELKDALHTSGAYAMQGSGFYADGGFDFGAALSPFSAIETERAAQGVPVQLQARASSDASARPCRSPTRSTAPWASTTSWRSARTGARRGLKRPSRPPRSRARSASACAAWTTSRPSASRPCSTAPSPPSPTRGGSSSRTPICASG